MPHFQDVIAGHYVTKAELDQADQDQAERNELGELHSSNLAAPIQQEEPTDDTVTVWNETEMEVHITREIVLWHRRLSQAATASGMSDPSSWSQTELMDFAAI